MTQPTTWPIRAKLRSAMFKLPMMMGCDALELKIDDYLEQDLTWADRLKFEMHLKVCRECRAYLAAYQRTIDVTGAMFDVPYTSMGMGEVTETLVQDILRQGRET